MSANTMGNTTIDETGEFEGISTERFLTFNSDGLTLGVSTDYVIEIITNHQITVVPLVPDYVKGIINLRGETVPIIDIRLRMGKAPIEYTSNTCIIVLNINSTHVGIVVDAVQQVIDIDISQVSPVPIESQQELINGMISLNNHSVLQLLDCTQLIQVY